MSLPNFLIIGAPRCATTSLYHYLRLHPEIFMSSVKEPRYFIYTDYPTKLMPKIQVITSLEDYKKLFIDVQNEHMIGEATATYIGRADVPQRIQSLIPDCKLIIMLRKPTERTISHYRLRMNEGKEARSLEKVIADERQLFPIIDAPLNTYATTFSFYHAHLTRFLEIFPKEQIHIELVEDFQADTKATLNRIYHFLGVSPDFFSETSQIYNRHHRSRSQNLSHLLNQDNILKQFAQNILPPKLKVFIRNSIHRLNTRNIEIVIREETIHELHKIFREDTLKLQELLERDLSHWLE